MQLNEIQNLRIPNLLGNDAWVFLWTTQRYLPDAFTIIKSWGLEYRRTMVWMKGTGNAVHGNQNPGQPKSNVEFIVVGSIGQPNVDGSQGI